MKSIVFNNCHVDIRAERIFKAGVGAFWFYDGKLFYNEELADNFKMVTKVSDPALYVETNIKSFAAVVAWKWWKLKKIDNLLPPCRDKPEPILRRKTP